MNEDGLGRLGLRTSWLNSESERPTPIWDLVLVPTDPLILCSCAPALTLSRSTAAAIPSLTTHLFAPRVLFPLFTRTSSFTYSTPVTVYSLPITPYLPTSATDYLDPDPPFRTHPRHPTQPLEHSPQQLNSATPLISADPLPLTDRHSTHTQPHPQHTLLTDHITAHNELASGPWVSTSQMTASR